jgi:pantoate--beta-alanine ligase
MSSRNTYLNQEERQAATVLFRALTAAKSAYQDGQRDADTLRDIMIQKLEKQPLTKLQYVSVAHPNTLEELDTVASDALLSMAVYIGKTRLIDNFLLQEESWQIGEMLKKPAS